MTTGAGTAALSLTFWGVRGSVPVPGVETLAFGGNTTCMEVVADGRLFILDAGTGIINLSRALPNDGTRRYDLLLSHLHHDHVLGLFSFAPLFESGCEVVIHCGNLGGESAEEALRRMYSDPLFPMTFDKVASTVRFVGFCSGETLDFGDLSVRTFTLRHPGGATGYRFDHGGRSIAIVTDYEHASAAPDDDLVAFVRGADIVVYDSMWDEPDYDSHVGWGHSTPEMGAALVRAAGAGRLICFHHAPDYDDARLSRMESGIAAKSPGASFARERQTISLARAQIMSVAAMRD